MYCVLDIYKRNLKIVYKTTLCSKTTFFVLLTTAVAIVIPFIFAYRSRGFWLKHDTFYEQPTVRFRGEYFFVGLTNNISNIIICNNIHEFPQLNELDKCATFKVREIDKNHDGKVDTFEFQMEIANMSHTHTNYLQHVTLFLPLDYRLNTMCPLKMQAAIILQQALVPKTNKLFITANLQLKQKTALYCYTKGTDKLNNNLLIKNEDQIDNYRIENIINNYLQRNLTTHLTEVYATYDFKQENFRLNLQVNYAEQRIYYRPGFWQVIKWAWIQYLAIFVAFGWFIRKLRNYMFENDLLLAYKSLPDALFQRLVDNKKYH